MHLDSGDLLLLYTDGVTEAANAAEEMFEEEGLSRLLGRVRDREPAAVLDAVRSALVAWTGRTAFDDDLTMMALKRP
jgi:sigma-B regulation protein RsbU (phosphoserine phosphatase)